MVEMIVCAWCGRGFEPTRQSQRFCSRSCSAMARVHAHMGAFEVDDAAETRRLRVIAARAFERETGLAMDEGARKR